MPWVAYLTHFIAASVLTNGIPHFVAGVSGRSFRTPFVRLTGGRFSSPALNVVWGWVNALVALLLFANVGRAYIGSLGDTIFIAAGILLAGLGLAKLFERD